MSIKLLDRCWRFSKAKGGDLLVLLGIADFANDEGDAYPSIPTLAKKARLTTRNTQRAIRRLMTAKELLIEDGKGPHRVHLYRITLLESPKLEGCQNVMVTKSQDDNLDSGRVTFQPPNPSEETVINNDTRVGDDKTSPSRPSTEVGKKKLKLVPMPAEFTISTSVWTWANKQGFAQEMVEREFETFCNDRLSKGVQYADWDRGFMTWLGRKREFAVPQRIGHVNKSPLRRVSL